LDFLRDEICFGAHYQHARKIMKILALELSSRRGNVALLNEENQPVVFEFPNDQKHSGAFFQTLQSLADRCRTLDSIVVGLGPGSYAGIRIAIGTAIGLQAASSARLVGLPSICAIPTDANEYCMVGDARRQSFFFVRVRAHEVVEGFDLYDEQELRGRLEELAGKVPVYSSEVLAQFGEMDIRYPSARVLAELVQHRKVSVSKGPLEPIYLRTPHITIPKPKLPHGQN
jgi:tRNA threonylcarbamoyladenosine biosynthesis protein TsaB